MLVAKKTIEFILSNYSLGRLINYSIPKQGLLNKVVLIKTTKGSYVVKIALVNINTLDYVLDLLNHIKMKKAPRPILTAGKKLFCSFGNYKAFIYPVILGRTPGRLSVSMSQEIGKFLAEYHSRSKGFKEIGEREEILSLSVASIEKAIKLASSVKTAKGREALRYISKEIWKYNLPDKLPSGPIHVDVKPDNSLFIGNKLQGVVDFDNVYHGPLVLDIGVAMSWYGADKAGFNRARIKALYSAYFKKRKLNNLEKKYLFNALHFAVLRNSLRAIEFLAQGKLPQKWVHDYLDYYLRAERDFNISQSEFI